MSAILNYILSVVALILTGVFATFLMLLNFLKIRTERENKIDKT